MGREPRGGYDQYDEYDGRGSRPSSSHGQRATIGQVGSPRAALTPPSGPAPSRGNGRNGTSDPRPNGRGGSGPRAAREEDARRREAYDEAPPARDGRSRRTLSRMAREFSQVMSRQVGSIMRGTEHAVRRMAEPRPGYYPSFAGSSPADLPSEPIPARYRRSRIRLRARKWRLARAPSNPVKYFTILASIALAVAVAIGAGGAGTVYAVNYYNQHLTQIQALAANLQNGDNTTIYDRNGKILYQVRDVNSNFNIYAPLQQVSSLVRKATIDTEDPTFYSALNIGIDFKSLLRAGTTDVSCGACQGGSTITQQLVKNIVLDNASKSIQRKVNEAILAIGVTLNYTKDQILEMYLNSIDYGNNNQGIEAAARNYFGLGPINHTNGQATTMANEQLSLAQIAILVALPNNPTYYNPVVFSCASTCPVSKWANPCTNSPEDDVCNANPNYCDNAIYGCGKTNGHEWLVWRRARLVLADMVNYDDLTLAQEKSALNDVMTILQKHQISQAAGTANGNVVETNKNAPHFVDWLLNTVLPNDFGINPDLLAHAGLKIYTTLDYNLDYEAQKLLTYYINGDPNSGTFTNYWYCGASHHPPVGGCQQQGLALSGNVHNGAVVAIDPHTGDILAMVGSVDYGSKDPQVLGFNNIATSDSRSMGSSTKPLVYSTAFQMGWTPGTMLQDAPVCYPVSDPAANPYTPACKGWYSPTNYEEWSFAGRAPIRTLLANSLNIPATETMSFVGDGAADTSSDAFLAMAQRLGVTTLTKGAMGPATALGGQDISLLQLTGAYATFADAGVRHPYRAVLEIQDSQGNILYQAPQSPRGQQVLSPQAAYMLTSILTDNKARLPDFGWWNPLYFADQYMYDGTTKYDYPDLQIAAKTGTSQGNGGPLDIVTMGYSPYLAFGVWFGNTPGNDPLTPGIIGIAGAGYVFHDLMQWSITHYKWPTNAHFPIPPGLARGQFNCTTGLAPYKGQKPQYCQYHAAVPPPPGYSFDIYAGLCPYPAGYGGCSSYPDIDWYDAGEAPLQS